MLEYDPYSPEALEDPLPIYKRLRDEAPCYYIEKRDCWALSRFQDVWDGFNENECFTSRYGDIPNLVMREPREPAVVMISHLDYEEHRRIMKTVGASLGLRAIERIAAGSTILLIACHFVPPRASAPSRMLPGTARRLSWLTRATLARSEARRRSWMSTPSSVMRPDSGS